MSVSTRLSRHPSPLPAGLTPLLGREHESEQICALLTDASNRLVTVTGPGGVGKTRLALHVAATLRDEFGRDVVYVPLASIHDPHLVLPTIAQTFGVFSDTQDAPEDQLVEVLQDRNVLLVLDNFEQILDAAPSLANVLVRCPDITTLVTSQAPLDIAGEQLYPLHPPAIPSTEQTTAESILEVDAVALFVQRARSVNPNLAVDDRMAQTIAEICRKLDGLPLAIELAAARINILSPDALLARLSNRLQVLSGERRGVPDRLRTMRHAIAWSYDLLTPGEQALLRRTAVFVGGISLDAVETIFEPSDDGRDAYDVLSALVNHSLVHVTPVPSGEARFLMLETLRDYGLEQLELTGEEQDARLAHAIAMMKLSEEAEPHLTGSDQQAWLNRLDPDTENLRAAVDWALTSGHEEITLRIGASNWRFCSTRGLASDCLARLEQALATEASMQSPYRANALVGAGSLAQDLHDLETAHGYFEQARALAVESGGGRAECHALIGLGSVAHDRGAYAEAFVFHEQTATLAREIGDQRSTAMALSNMAAVSYYQGKLDDAEPRWEETCEILAVLGDTTTEAIVFSNLGSVSFERGDFDRAEQRLSRALKLQRQVGASRDLPYTLVNLGEVWCRLGDFTLAHDHYAEAIALCRRADYTVLEGVTLNGVAKLALAQGDPGRAASLILKSTRMVVESGDQRSIVENAEVLAAVCSERGAHAEAAELMGAAASIRGKFGTVPNPVKIADLNAMENNGRAALTKRDYTRAWEAGSQLDITAMTRRIGIIARQLVGNQQPSIDSSGDIPSEEAAVAHDLTARETEVLRLLAQGKSTREVSEALFITSRTTSTHITNILGKLRVESRTAAVAYAMRTGLV